MKVNRNILLVFNHEVVEPSHPAVKVIEQLNKSLSTLNLNVHYAWSTDEAITLLNESHHYSAIGIVLDSALDAEQNKVIQLVSTIRIRNKNIPILLLSERDIISQLSLSILQEVREYIYLFSETSDFMANRINTAINQYYAQLLPPYFKALKDFTENGDYYWDCPGHMGGMAYTKHPVGAEFLHFFGENIMRADIGVATSEMGDYLEHCGVPKLSENNAARLFGAEWSFYSVGGSSASNRIVAQGAIGENEIAVVDRNCHKSLNHGLTLCHALPVYLKPTRNGYGMIGPIPANRMSKEHIATLIKQSALAKQAESADPTYAVVTNCTYDGFCYNTNQVAQNLSQSVPRIHFDEAWYAYAKFHSLYQGRFAMGIDDDMPNRPTIFAVQSTHKMLPALSMASMIHVKTSPRAPLNYHDFNDAFMMHGTTSPFYPIIASMDVAVAMMEGESGQSLIQESLEEAIAFRKAIVNIKRQVKEQHGEQAWFFDVLQPDQVTDQQTGKTYSFEQAPFELLTSDATCWKLDENASWHGFSREDIAGTDCMLDPVKVTLTCPGITPDGQPQTQGIPGYILTKFLDSRCTEIARTGDYTVLILFSVGTTKGKWGTLIESLLEFKRLYDHGALASEAIPSLVTLSPVYNQITLKELCDRMHSKMTSLQLLTHLDAAVNADPEPIISPAAAFQKVVRYKTESVPVSHFGGRLAASMLVPYPPGIPLLMPGERVPEGDSAIRRYLMALQEFDRAFPGFEHEIHGVSVGDKGEFWVRAVIEEDRQPQVPQAINWNHVASTAAKKGRQ